jgi:YidC/Oxa1 family membrane protein insertase
MEDQNKNLILATVLSMIVVLVWMVFFPPPEAVVDPNASVVAPEAATAPALTNSAAAGEDATSVTAAEEAQAPRIAIATDELAGTISLLGGRIDDLRLNAYKQSLEPGAEDVRVLAPIGQENAYYAVFDWLPGAGLSREDVPGPKTVWQAAADAKLTVETPLVMTWDNGKGLSFTRTISVDDKFMFTITDAVQNSTAAEVRVAQRGVIARHGLPANMQNIFVVHEGLIRRTDGEFNELDYSEIEDLVVVEREGAPAEVIEATTDGWIGFTDHYWMTTLVPTQGTAYTSVAKYTPASNIYQAEVRQPLLTVAPGATQTAVQQLYAGAKEWETIRSYQSGGIAGFIDSIDWGWFYFLTKPIFAVLHWLNAQIGNMGWAIIGLTFILKILVLPLAYKSYVSMARMKELQPEIEALKERTGDDKPRFQKEMMQLYKDRKVNPAAGCLPILIQIPIFFALYKVIYVTIELRHAPFFGWLTDLSAPDASSLFNLFGLLPWDAPATGSLLHLIFLGILPIILGITMWLQQKLNPAPTDPVQQSIFAWMPWVFMFMMSSFASGLIVYWITNNTITFLQQYIIMRSHGHKPDIFGNIRKGFARSPAAAANVAPPSPPKATPPVPPPAANSGAAPRKRRPRK